MAQAGTLLSDLDSQSGGNDGDLVQKILADMNQPSQRGPPPPPPMPQQTPSQYAQMPSTTIPMTMDSRIPTTHMIGNEHPTPADFAAAMHGMNVQQGSPMGSQQYAAPIGMMPGAQQPIPMTQQSTSKNIYGRILDEIKTPLLVAFLFLTFSLPPVRVLLAHYLPSILKPTGELTMLGLVGIAVTAGAIFWFLQRVIAPLLSL